MKKKIRAGEFRWHHHAGNNKQKIKQHPALIVKRKKKAKKGKTIIYETFTHNPPKNSNQHIPLKHNPNPIDLQKSYVNKHAMADKPQKFGKSIPYMHIHKDDKPIIKHIKRS